MRNVLMSLALMSMLVCRAEAQFVVGDAYGDVLAGKTVLVCSGEPTQWFDGVSSYSQSPDEHYAQGYWVCWLKDGSPTAARMTIVPSLDAIRRVVGQTPAAAVVAVAPRPAAVAVYAPPTIVQASWVVPVATRPPNVSRVILTQPTETCTVSASGRRT